MRTPIEPIIDQETFDNVQRIRGQVRRYPNGWGESYPLTGLMYCADCGGKMYVHRVNNKEQGIDREPTIRIDAVANALERKGIQTERVISIGKTFAQNI